MTAMPDPRPSAEDRIRAACWFAERGFGIFSVWSTDPDGTCRCAKHAACEQPGKHPIGHQGFHDATRDPARIRTLLSAASEPNYGLVCPDGVFALDVDGDGIPRLTALEAQHGPLPPTLRTNTAHGQHVFLRWPDSLPRPIGQMFGYVTRWGSGAGAGYVIGPRSVHASGAVYAPAGPFLEIAPLPDAWARAAIAEKAPAITIRGSGPQSIQVGNRHEYLRNQARHLRGLGLTGDALFTAVNALNLQLAEPKTEDAVRRAIGDVETKFGHDLVAADEKEPDTDEDPSRPIHAISSDPPAPLLIERLDPEGHTILYGTGGVGKGALACRWTADLVHAGLRVLILDYEAHPEEWSRRIRSLAPDVHAGDGVRHMTPKRSLSHSTKSIRQTCDRHAIDYVVIDSAVMACGSDPLKPEAAAEYAAALIDLGRPALSLAHVTKVDDPRYPFGSVFWHNLARMTWSLSGTDSETLLRHRKHNNYEGLGTLAVTYTWVDGVLREVWEKGYNATVLRRALDALDDGGAMSLEEILAAINDGEHKSVTRKTLQQTLRRALVSEVRLGSDEKYRRA
jgi:hypothetical protein